MFINTLHKGNDDDDDDDDKPFNIFLMNVMHQLMATKPIVTIK
jgi:hypothetical protein